MCTAVHTAMHRPADALPEVGKRAVTEGGMRGGLLSLQVLPRHACDRVVLPEPRVHAHSKSPSDWDRDAIALRAAAASSKAAQRRARVVGRFAPGG